MTEALWRSALPNGLSIYAGKIKSESIYLIYQAPPTINLWISSSMISRLRLIIIIVPRLEQWWTNCLWCKEDLSIRASGTEWRSMLARNSQILFILLSEQDKISRYWGFVRLQLAYAFMHWGSAYQAPPKDPCLAQNTSHGLRFFFDKSMRNIELGYLWIF